MRFQSFLEKIHWYFTELDLTWHLEDKSFCKKIFLSLNILLFFFFKVKHQLRFKNINKNHIFIKHNWSNRFQFFHLFFFLSFKMVKKVHQDFKDNCIKKIMKMSNYKFQFITWGIRLSSNHLSHARTTCSCWYWKIPRVMYLSQSRPFYVYINICVLTGVI